LPTLGWWCTSIIPLLRRLRQENHEFWTNLGYLVKFRSKTKKQNKIKSTLAHKYINNSFVLFIKLSLIPYLIVAILFWAPA
jgi:hypothetical protein